MDAWAARQAEIPARGLRALAHPHPAGPLSKTAAPCLRSRLGRHPRLHAFRPRSDDLDKRSSAWTAAIRVSQPLKTLACLSLTYINPHCREQHSAQQDLYPGTAPLNSDVTAQALVADSRISW